MSKDANTPPASKADINRIEDKLDKLVVYAARTDQRFERLHNDIDRVLTVLENVDKKLVARTKDHETRLRRLEVKLELVV